MDTKCIWSILFLAKVVFGDALKSRGSGVFIFGGFAKIGVFSDFAKNGYCFWRFWYSQTYLDERW